ncbi:MAG: IPT/TIG domain-containing protein [Gemmatimonadota bacterium]
MRASDFAVLSLVLAVTACGESTGPSDPRVSISVQSGDGQFGVAGGLLAEPLQVIVTDPVTKQPRDGVTVQWRLITGTGALLLPPSTETGEDGVASIQVTLGSQLGTYEIEASAPRLVGDPARFDAHAVLTPTITTLAPKNADVGDTITITGTNFSTNADDNTVLFGSMRGRVLSATTTQLRVIVPSCLPTRTVSVVVTLGAVASNQDAITVAGGTPVALQLQVGQAAAFRDPRELECQLLRQTTSRYLMVAQNVSEVVGTRTPFELIGLTNSPIALVASASSPPPADDYGSVWELKLRTLERGFIGPLPDRPELSPNAFVAAPEVGDRREFKVFDKNEKFTKINAEIKAISQHAIIYQDLNAPANGFSTSQFQQLGAAFDSPSYEIDVDVFGQPTDADANGKIIILLTPVVNELTPAKSSGFIAGFFFGCDLQTTQQCSGSNAGELFYLFVPDPTGKHGNVRSPQTVLNSVLPVLAHEFQHMINFGARRSLDALWLSEGLAHQAEDLVADEYARRGDTFNAGLFRVQNYSRAGIYLRDLTGPSLIAEALPGTLELRGGAWLMVKYLEGHYGGKTLLRALTNSTSSGVANVTAAAGQPWSTLLSEWAVALWADNVPGYLPTGPLNPKHTFLNFNLRTALASNYSLAPGSVGLTDFVIAGSLGASSQRYVLLDQGGARPVNLAFTGQRGGPFASGALPQLTILRIQ